MKSNTQHALPQERKLYYERPGVPGVCVFVDGPHHDSPTQTTHDQSVRSELANLRFRVIAVRHDQAIAEQVQANPDVFWPILSERTS
jgi:hypothetical protein